MQDRLKPCPFCGGEMYETTEYGDGYNMRCRSRHCTRRWRDKHGNPRIFITPGEATAAWRKLPEYKKSVVIDRDIAQKLLNEIDSGLNRVKKNPRKKNRALALYKLLDALEMAIAAEAKKDPKPVLSTPLKECKTLKNKGELHRYMGRKISEIRTGTGYTQEELARHLELDRTSIASYEAGRNRVSIIMLYKIADFFDRSVFDFLPETLDKCMETNK